jgi:small GTP-binding protein
MVDQIKIVLTGSCGTGKTSIISRLIFDSFSEDYVSTDGGACGQYTFTYEEFDNKQLIMDIWDTAGQEKYRALTRIFYKDSAVAILVYDITNKKTFEELKTYWNPQLKQVGNEEISKCGYIYIDMHLNSSWNCCK